MSSKGSHDAITPQRVARVLWRRKLVCSIAAAAVFLAGAGFLLGRAKTYDSTSSVALLPVSTNVGILPNYPNLIASLIPTYVQLVSSPVLLNQVAATLPFATSETQLANDVHAESLSGAAIINIVAQSRSATEAQQIASRTTAVFLTELSGNGVVIPSVYAEPVVPSKPAPPSIKLMLGAIAALGIVLGIGAGLLWDRLSGDGDGDGDGDADGDGTRQPPESTHPPILGVIPKLAEQRDVSTVLDARDNTAPLGRWGSLRTNFMYSTAARQVRSVTVTSLHPGEGKTTVAVNLAASLAELGLSVVLVDGAMDRPALHEVFGIDNSQGLTSTVISNADPGSLLTPVPSIEGLQVVTAGPRLSTFGEAQFCLRKLQRFCPLGDLVIVDGPALQGGASADLVASVTDAVVLVVPAGLAWSAVVDANLRILEKYEIPVLGTVLIAADGIVHGYGESLNAHSYPTSGMAPHPVQSR